MIYDRNERSRRRGGCGNWTVECAAPATYGQTAGVINSNPLEGYQCEPVVTYETVVEPTVYYTLADVENVHYVKHIVPVVYQQTITNVTQHEYVMEKTLDQAQEEVSVGYESNVAGLVSSPCNDGTAQATAGAYGMSEGCAPAVSGCNAVVHCCR